MRKINIARDCPRYIDDVCLSGTYGFCRRAVRRPGVADFSGVLFRGSSDCGFGGGILGDVLRRCRVGCDDGDPES